jgi:hypothetical protein
MEDAAAAAAASSAVVVEEERLDVLSKTGQKTGISKPRQSPISLLPLSIS